MWNVLRYYIDSYVKDVFTVLLFLFFVRIYIVYQRIHNSKKTIPRAKSPTSKIMFVLGSGGHTYEMLKLIKNMSHRFTPRIYVVADTDEMSEMKIKMFESEGFFGGITDVKSTISFAIEKIPRCREVQQSWLSTVFTTTSSCFYSLLIILKCSPQAIVCNGPGTCVPLCVIAFFLHVLAIKKINVIFVESICRTHTLSLSGKILYYIADHFLVQWPQLKEKYPRAKYLGHLV